LRLHQGAANLIFAIRAVSLEPLKITASDHRRATEATRKLVSTSNTC